jgi:hypothetical protein
VRRGQRRVAWKDAPRLVSKKDAQKFHNAGRLQGIIAQGSEHTTLSCWFGESSANRGGQERILDSANYQAASSPGG